MNDHEQKRFNRLYQRHVLVLKLRGYAASTIDVYARAVRRLVAYFDCVPDRLSVEQLETYFANLVDSHSWALSPQYSGLPTYFTVPSHRSTSNHSMYPIIALATTPA